MSKPRVTSRPAPSRQPRVFRPYWRDARQIADVGAFFAGSRPAGPVAVAPWAWPAMLGRPGALAFLASCEAVCHDETIADNVRDLMDVWPTTMFADPTARFRVVETTPSELPFPLPEDPEGSAHHGVLWNRRRFLVSNYPILGRVIAARNHLLSAVVVLEQLPKRGAPTPLRGFLERETTGASTAGVVRTCTRLTRAQGPFATSPAVLRRLSKGGLGSDVARALWSGEALSWRSLYLPLDLDFEQLAQLSHDTVGEHPEQLWDEPLVEDGPVDRLLASYQATWSLAQRLAKVRAGNLGKLRSKQPPIVQVPPSGAISPRARPQLAEICGRTRDLTKMTDAELASEIQQLRYDLGPDALAEQLAPILRALSPAERASTIDYLYQFTEHSH